MSAFLAVLEAFGVIGVIIAIGAILGRTDVLGEQARLVLNRVAFHVGVPALLVLTLSRSTLEQIFSLPLLVSALATIGVFCVCFVFFTIVRRRGSGDATIASWTASYVNAGNLGIPLSTYVFGSTTDVSAIILFQSVVLVPAGIAILNSLTEPPRSLGRQVLGLVRNPIIVGSGVGLVVAATGLPMSGFVTDTLRLLADLAIPTVLLAFGISLSSRSDQMSASNRLDLAVVVFSKTIAMPIAAYALAKWCFAASPAQVLLVTVLAALPSAQNINAYAAVYRRNESLAAAATLISTAVSIPIIMIIVFLLSPWPP